MRLKPIYVRITLALLWGPLLSLMAARPTWITAAVCAAGVFAATYVIYPYTEQP